MSKHIDREYYTDQLLKDQTFILKIILELCNKREKYLNVFKNSYEGNSELYLELKSIYDQLPSLYNRYISSVLSTNLHLTPGVSDYTAAAVGTFIGGTAVGMVAAEKAREYRKEVAENERQIRAHEIKKGGLWGELENCFEQVSAMIRQNEFTAKDWEQTLNNMINGRLDQIEMNFQRKHKRNVIAGSIFWSLLGLFWIILFYYTYQMWQIYH
ncbi:MAG: hypothetical protein LUC25_03975 [Ruminococcus sp.]|nr:hypothetical protein [Ruminococcus sp.]